MANQLENIAGLQSILETVNSLPDAGSGGGTSVFTACPTDNSSAFSSFGSISISAGAKIVIALNCAPDGSDPHVNGPQIFIAPTDEGEYNKAYFDNIASYDFEVLYNSNGEAYQLSWDSGGTLINENDKLYNLYVAFVF